MADIANTPEEGNAAAVTAPDENQIPEKYRGKSEQDIIQMHQELEKKLAQQGEELGSLRQLADQSLLIADSSSEQSEDVDFYADPEKAIVSLIKRELAPFNELTSKQQQQQVAQRLDTDFPGWKDTSANEDFQNWVAKSKVRTELWMRADNADLDAATELFGTWSELGNATKARETTAKKAVQRDRKLRAATTEKGAAAIDPRKILNRADLRSMAQNNPTRYRELLPDIRKAYAEGRVK